LSTAISVAGNRKYGPIWSKLKETGICKVECDSTEDTLTTINGVKKEKSQDKNKPKKKVLKIKTGSGPSGGIQIEFRLVTDTSINNL